MLDILRTMLPSCFRFPSFCSPIPVVLRVVIPGPGDIGSGLRTANWPRALSASALHMFGRVPVMELDRGAAVPLFIVGGLSVAGVVGTEGTSTMVGCMGSPAGIRKRPLSIPLSELLRRCRRWRSDGPNTGGGRVGIAPPVRSVTEALRGIGPPLGGLPEGVSISVRSYSPF